MTLKSEFALQIAIQSQVAHGLITTWMLTCSDCRTLAPSYPPTAYRHPLRATREPRQRGELRLVIVVQVSRCGS